MLTSDGDVPVAVWTGSGLVLYWLAVLGLAALGAETARRAAPAIVAVALVAAVVAAGPIAVRLATGNVPMGPGEKRMPALVQVAGEQNPNTRTLVVSAVGEHALRAEIITGEGLELDELRTAARISGPDAADQRLAELVAALASIGGGSVGEALNAERVHYVLLAEGQRPDRRNRAAAHARSAPRTCERRSDRAGPAVARLRGGERRGSRVVTDSAALARHVIRRADRVDGADRPHLRNAAARTADR